MANFDVTQTLRVIKHTKYKFKGCLPSIKDGGKTKQIILTAKPPVIKSAAKFLYSCKDGENVELYS